MSGICSGVGVGKSSGRVRRREEEDARVASHKEDDGEDDGEDDEEDDGEDDEEEGWSSPSPS